MTTLNTVAVVGAAAFTAWILMSVALQVGLRAPVLEWAWLILKWPVLAAPPLAWLDCALQGGNAGADALLLAFYLWMWWFYRNSGDDDFRRRLKSRVAGKVQALAGRLVVVPT